MFDYRSNTKADEVVKLAKLYKKTKKYLTMEDVKELIKVVYKGDSDYLTALATMMSSNSTKKKNLKKKNLIKLPPPILPYRKGLLKTQAFSNFCNNYYHYTDNLCY
jgi:hypothetical protein